MIKLEEVIIQKPGIYDIFIDMGSRNISDCELRILQKNRDKYVFRRIVIYDFSTYSPSFIKYITEVIFEQKDEFNLEVYTTSSL